MPGVSAGRVARAQLILADNEASNEPAILNPPQLKQRWTTCGTGSTTPRPGDRARARNAAPRDRYTMRGWSINGLETKGPEVEASIDKARCPTAPC